MSNTFKVANCLGREVASAQYHKQEFKRGDRQFVMSRSELCSFARCPSKWIHGATSDSTDATEWGDLFDCLVTDAKRFNERFAVKPETYTNEKGEVKPWNGNATVCKTWAENQTGKTLVKAETMQSANFAVKRLCDDNRIYDFLSASDKQVMLIGDYYDYETRLTIPVKALVDLVPWHEHPDFGKCLGDLKTCRDASPFAFKWSAFRLGYHVQSALYMDLYRAAFPNEDRQEWRLILSENVHPYEPARRWLDIEMVQLGRVHYLSALKLYCQCLLNDRWPSFDDGDGGLIPGWGQISPDAKMQTTVAEHSFGRLAEPEAATEQDQGIIP